jgi:subtilisin family serine protease
VAAPSWGLDRIDQRSLPLDSKYHYPNTGSSVVAYIIDTGILLTHQEFGGRAVCGFDPFGGGCVPCGLGHGTHVAGTVGGVTTGVTVV